MLSAIASYVLSAMTAWVPLEAHASFEAPDVTATRYAAIAADIARASEERPVIDGDPARTGVLLAAVASYESAFAARVADCSTPGGRAGERAWSLWQVEGPRGKLCASTLAAARVAVAMLGESLAACRSRAVDTLSLYTVGKCTHDEKARWRWLRATRWWAAHPFEAEPS